MSNIIVPTFKLDESKFVTWLDCKWPEILITQHCALDSEIKSVNELLNRSKCSLTQLDVRLKKLTKGLLTHLQLEADFLTPMLDSCKLTSTQKIYLNQSFDALFTTCRVTSEYIHSLKLIFGNDLVTIEQRQRVSCFLDEIKKRLNDEDIIYLQMDEKRGIASGV